MALDGDLLASSFSSIPLPFLPNSMPSSPIYSPKPWKQRREGKMEIWQLE